MLYAPRPRQSASGPAGVALDIARVESVLTPEPGGSDRGLAAVPVMMHRKPVVAAVSRSDLMESDLQIDFSPVEMPWRGPEPTGWEPDAGFSFPDDDDRTFRTRRIRRRAAGDESAPDELEPDEAESDEDAIEDREATTRYVPVPGRRSVFTSSRYEVPPYDLVETVHSITGVHVGDARIDRSAPAADKAAELGAVAFTRGDVVHLPAELGPLDDPAVRAIAAHELVHVAQQRRRAGAVPPEDSDDGRALETQARAVQQQIAAGAVVTPAFLRARPQLREGPVGVQRLADTSTGYVGEDLSDHDYSDIEPGQTNDPFRWQLREGEPQGVPWAERQQWARQFEESHGSELQFQRDARIRQMAGTTPPASETDLDRLHRELDAAMPYQFGPPLGLIPYVEIPIHAPAPGGTPTGTSGGGSGGTTTGGGTTTTATSGAQATGGGTDATAAASRTALAAMLTAARHDRRDETGLYSPEDLIELGETRQNTERAHRRSLLEAKAAAAHQAGAAGTTQVTLTADEIRQVRGVVDAEHINPGLPYLDEAIEATGTVGALVPSAEPGGRMVHRASTPATPTTPTTPTTPSPAPGAHPTTHSDAHADEHAGGTTTGAGATEASRMIEALTTQTRATHHTETTINLTPERLMAEMQRRLDRERQLRTELLTAKVHDAAGAQPPDDYVVTLSTEECNTIRAAVDAQFPMLEGLGVYLGDDEVVSMNMHGVPGGAATTETIEQARTRHQQAGGAHAATTATAPSPTTHTPQAGTAAHSAPADHGAPTPVPHGATDHTPEPAHHPDTPTPTAIGGQQAADPEHASSTVEALNDIDLERLTRKLWSRIRREIRSELLIDRERSGTLADTR